MRLGCTGIFFSFWLFVWVIISNASGTAAAPSARLLQYMQKLVGCAHWGRSVYLIFVKWFSTLSNTNIWHMHTYLLANSFFCSNTTDDNGVDDEMDPHAQFLNMDSNAQGRPFYFMCCCWISTFGVSLLKCCWHKNPHLARIKFRMQTHKNNSRKTGERNFISMEIPLQQWQSNVSVCWALWTVFKSWSQGNLNNNCWDNRFRRAFSIWCRQNSLLTNALLFDEEKIWIFSRTRADDIYSFQFTVQLMFLPFKISLSRSSSNGAGNYSRILLKFTFL